MKFLISSSFYKIIQNKVKNVRYGTEAVSFLDTKIWNLAPIEYKEIES